MRLARATGGRGRRGEVKLEQLRARGERAELAEGSAEARVRVVGALHAVEAHARRCSEVLRAQPPPRARAGDEPRVHARARGYHLAALDRAPVAPDARALARSFPAPEPSALRPLKPPADPFERSRRPPSARPRKASRERAFRACSPP